MENTGRDRIGSGEPTNGDRWVGGMASLVAFDFEIIIHLFEEKFRTETEKISCVVKQAGPGRTVEEVWKRRKQHLATSPTSTHTRPLIFVSCHNSISFGDKENN